MNIHCQQPARDQSHCRCFYLTSAPATHGKIISVFTLTIKEEKKRTMVEGSSPPRRNSRTEGSVSNYLQNWESSNGNNQGRNPSKIRANLLGLTVIVASKIEVTHKILNKDIVVAATKILAHVQKTAIHATEEIMQRKTVNNNIFGTNLRISTAEAPWISFS